MGRESKEKDEDIDWEDDDHVDDRVHLYMQ